MLYPWELVSGAASYVPGHAVVSNWAPAAITDSYTTGGVTFQGADAAGVRDSAPAIRYWLGAVPAGSLLRAPAGRYIVKQTCPFVKNGTWLFGEGEGATSIVADDSGGNIGDVFQLQNLSRCRLTGMTIDAVSGRSAGCAVRIKGGDANMRLNSTFQIRAGGHVVDVDMMSQFNGVIVEDDTAAPANGDWASLIGSHDRKPLWRDFQAGGTGILINTPHGASQIISQIFLVGKTGSVPLAAIQVRGTGDVTMRSLQTIGFTNGYLHDPQAASADTIQLVQIDTCQFDGCSGDNIRINPGAGGTTTTFIEIADTWIASATGNGLKANNNSVPTNVHITGASRIFNNGLWGARVEDGIPNTKVIIDAGVQFSNNGSGSTSYV